MQLGEIRDQAIIGEYLTRLRQAIDVAVALKSQPRHNRYVPNLNIVLGKLERIIEDTKQGRIMNEIVGLTKFAGDWPIEDAKLAMAIWEAERYFSETIIKEATRQMGRP